MPGDPMTYFERDIIQWSTEQAAVLRAGDFARLDIDAIATVIDRAGQAKRDEFFERVCALIRAYMTVDAGCATLAEIRLLIIHRKAIGTDMKSCRSLIKLFYDPEWLDGAWMKATSMRCVTDAPIRCPWSADDLLEKGFCNE